MISQRVVSTGRGGKRLSLPDVNSCAARGLLAPPARKGFSTAAASEMIPLMRNLRTCWSARKIEELYGRQPGLQFTLKLMPGRVVWCETVAGVLSAPATKSATHYWDTTGGSQALTCRTKPDRAVGAVNGSFGLDGITYGPFHDSGRSCSVAWSCNSRLEISSVT